MSPVALVLWVVFGWLLPFAIWVRHDARERKALRERKARRP
jgi:hypothetical protein